MKRLAVQVGEYQVGRFGGDERATVQRLGPESPNAVLGIMHERHPQTLSRPGKFEAARERYAHLTLTGTLGLDLPAGLGLKVSVSIPS